jgi:hypothetical protein
MRGNANAKTRRAEDSSYQPLLDLFFAHAPESLLSAFPNAQKGHTGTPKPKQNTIDTSKTEKTFGWKAIGKKETVLDMAKSLEEYQKRWSK